MKKYKLIITILIIATILIISGVILATSKTTHDNKNLPPAEEKQGFGEGSEDYVERWDKELSMQSINIFNEVYPTDYIFTLNEKGEYRMTLAEFTAMHEKQFPMLNTATVSCNLETSVFIITYEEMVKEFVRGVQLDCKQLTT